MNQDLIGFLQTQGKTLMDCTKADEINFENILQIQRFYKCDFKLAYLHWRFPTNTTTKFQSPAKCISVPPYTVSHASPHGIPTFDTTFMGQLSPIPPTPVNSDIIDDLIKQTEEFENSLKDQESAKYNQHLQRLEIEKKQQEEIKQEEIQTKLQQNDYQTELIEPLNDNNNTSESETDNAPLNNTMECVVTEPVQNNETVQSNKPRVAYKDLSKYKEKTDGLKRKIKNKNTNDTQKKRKGRPTIQEKIGENAFKNTHSHAFMYRRQKLIHNNLEKVIFTRKVEDIECETIEQFEIMTDLNDKRTKYLNLIQSLELKMKKCDKIERTLFPNIISVDDNDM